MVGEADSWVAQESDVGPALVEKPSDKLSSLQDQCWDLGVEQGMVLDVVSPFLHGDLMVY